MKRVIISVSNDLSTDQRVSKICETLVALNYEVLLIGRRLKNSFPIQRNYTTKRIRLLFNKGFLFYGELNIRLFLVLLFSKKDILLSNDLDTLLPNFLASKLQRKKLVYDSHELFTEIPELVHRPFVKKVWLTLEEWIFPKLKNVYTVSPKIAAIYTEKYNIPVNVIRNLPTKKQVKAGSFPFLTEDKKIILYQGAINLGRGLELMINTMPFLDNHVFVIIGDGDITNDLKNLVVEKNLTEKVKFLGKILPEKLHKLTLLADVGISFEADLGLNYRYALPNKIFDYIQAEVPVFVSDLPEIKKIILDYQIGEIIKSRTPEKIANQIKTLLEKDFSPSLKTAKKELIWEKEVQKLMAIFNTLK